MNTTKITINSHDVVLKFGMYSARYLADKFQKNYCFDGDEITEIGIAHVIYSGYMNACAVKDESPALTFEDMVDFVESSIGDTEKINAIASVVKVWSESQLIKAAGEGKKKTSKR
jgi:hypothetical protein